MAGLEEPPEQQVNTATSVSGASDSNGGEQSGLMSVVVIGGTGAVGRCLVGLLLKDKERFGKITLVGRRKMTSVHERYGVNIQEEEGSGRLIQVEQDMEAAEDDLIQRVCTGANAFFCCLGTTRKAAGSAERFYQIDHGIPLKFAKAAKAVGVSHYSLVTSWGANSKSIFLYTRTKGEIEEAVTNLKFDYTTILRPGGINREEMARTVEKIAGFFFKMIPASTIAEAMLIDAYAKHTAAKPEGDPSPEVTVLNNAMMFQSVQQAEQNRKANVGTSVDPPSGTDQAAEEEDKQEENEDKGTDDNGSKEGATVEETTQQQQDSVETPSTEEQLTEEKTAEDEETIEKQSTEEKPSEESPAEEQSTEDKQEQSSEEQTTEEKPSED